MKELLEVLERDGFVVLRGLGGYDRFEALSQELGEIVWKTDVRLKPTVKTHLCQPEAVPFHTDHPDVDFVAWWCERQEVEDGASLLVDSRDVLSSLSKSERAELRATALPCPAIGSRSTATASSSRFILSGEARVYYAPWVAVAGADGFGRELANARVTRVRLGRDDALIVDNHRILHGRGAVSQSSPRMLHRLWVRREQLETASRQQKNL